MSNTEKMVSVPREHELKIRQTPLADLLSGLKTGEVRDCSDREFAVGDTVLLREIDDSRDYTGTVLRRTITHVQKHYGLPDHLCVLSYGHPAEQHQGQPVALPERKDMNNLRCGGYWKEAYTGWNDCLDEIAKLGPLYTHSDPGEVERMREEIDTLKAAAMGIRDAWREDQVKLAERDALPQFAQTVIRKLKRFRDCAEDGQGADIGKSWFDVLVQLGLLNRVQRSPAWWEITGEGDALLDGSAAALSASAEPSAPDGHSEAWPKAGARCLCPACCRHRQSSAPVERDERAAFEAQISYPPLRQRTKNGNYSYKSVESEWKGWQARAALERKP